MLLGDELLTIGAIRDMSLQRRAERERAQQAEHLRLQAELIDLSHDAILIRESASRVIFWNKGAVELYGWSSQEALGRLTHSLLKTRFPTSLAEVDVHLERDGRWEGELMHTCRDGSHVVVESRQVLVCDVLGHATTMLEINRDITERSLLDRLPRPTISRPSLIWISSSSSWMRCPAASISCIAQMRACCWPTVPRPPSGEQQWHIDQPMQEFLATNGIGILDAQGRPLALTDLATLRAVQKGETVLHHQEIIVRPNGSSVPLQVTAIALDSRRSGMP